MPFKSKAQRRKFYATPSLHKYIDEFETKKRLPEKVKGKKKNKK